VFFVDFNFEIASKAKFDGHVVCVCNTNVPVLDLSDYKKMVGALVEQAGQAITVNLA